MLVGQYLKEMWGETERPLTVSTWAAAHQSNENVLARITGWFTDGAGGKVAAPGKVHAGTNGKGGVAAIVDRVWVHGFSDYFLG